MNKDQRRLEIYKFITKHGRAWAHDIVSHIGKLSGVESDSKTKQAVYRDLRILQESNEISSNLYTPSGDPIEVDEEESYSNVRVEYYSLTHDDSIRGQKLINQFESHIFATSIIEDSVSISEDYGVIPQNSCVLSIELASGVYRHLWFPKDQCPIHIHFGRLSGPVNEFKKSVSDKKGRNLFFAIHSRSVSRFESGLNGHCTLSFDKQSDKLAVTDHSSKQGTRFYDFRKNYITSGSFATGETVGIMLPTERYAIIQQAQEMSCYSMVIIGTVHVQISLKD